MDNFVSAIICFCLSAIMTAFFIDTGNSVVAGFMVYSFGLGIAFSTNK